MIKPFRTFEFIARIKALARRTGMQNGKKVKKESKAENMNWICRSRFCRRMVSESILQGPNIRFCRDLLTNAPNLVAREFLLDTIWDFNENYIDDNTLSVHMNRLRKKLTAENEQDPIETKRGVGYAWTLKAEDVYDEI